MYDWSLKLKVPMQANIVTAIMHHNRTKRNEPITILGSKFVVGNINYKHSGLGSSAEFELPLVIWLGEREEQPQVEPIPMLLVCPGCKHRHIDEGEFATKVHHTHACQHCGTVWRPAIVPTVGVRFLPGFKN